jgi:hypothetical protein
VKTRKGIRLTLGASFYPITFFFLLLSCDDHQVGTTSQVDSPECEQSQNGQAPEQAVSSFILDGNFVSDSPGAWRTSGSAKVQAGLVALEPSSQLSQGISVDRLQGARFCLIAEAQGSDINHAQLRLQGVWLPAGGWTETDQEGALVRVVEARVVDLSRTLQSYMLRLDRPDSATRLQIFLVNNGKSNVEIFQVRLHAL